MWTAIDTKELLSALESQLASYRLEPWGDLEFGRDALALYCAGAARPYCCLGYPEVMVTADDLREYANRCGLRRGEFSWSGELQRLVIEHLKIKRVFDRFVDICRDPGQQLRLWYDGDLLGNGVEESILGIDCIDWEPFWYHNTSQLGWLTFDTDTVLFSPNFDVAIVAFHHDCIEIAGINRDPVGVQRALGIEFMR